MIWNGLRAALAIFSGKISLIFGLPERLRTLRESIFTGKGDPSQALTRQLPRRGELLTRLQALRFSQKFCRHAKGSLPEGAGKTVRC